MTGNPLIFPAEFGRLRDQFGSAMPEVSLGPVLAPFPAGSAYDEPVAGRCGMCGCTDRNGCLPPCSWLSAPDVGRGMCSRCLFDPPRQVRR